MGNEEKRMIITRQDPAKMLPMFTKDEYETMVGQWLRSEPSIVRVKKMDGPRDKGRDFLCSGKKRDLFNLSM